MKKEILGEITVCGNPIFKPELECIAALVYYLGKSVSQRQLVDQMVKCDFHLDAIEKIQGFDANEYNELLNYIGNDLLDPTHQTYVGQELLDEFKEHCNCSL